MIEHFLEIIVLAASDWRNVVLAGLLFLAVCVASGSLVGILLARLPSDYFSVTHEGDLKNAGRKRSWPVRIIKNLIGAVLIILGFVMALPGVPGPGLLTVLLGIMLTDFKRKRQLELWLIHRPGVLIGINSIRRWFDKSPMLVG